MRSMEFTGVVADKFCIILTYEDTLSNEVKLPRQFCSKYSNLLEPEMELKLRNGYIQPVELDLVNCHMKGVLGLFKFFDLKGGELIMFEYFGRCKFNVYIIGKNLSEIRYPESVYCSAGIVTLGDGGWRFVTAFAVVDANKDEIEPPLDFIQRCGFALPERIVFVLRNGKSFIGSYTSETSCLSGISSLYKILGSEHLEVIRNLVFTFDGTEYFSITAFDSDNNEIVFPGNPLSADADGSLRFVDKYFRITVESKHMFNDSFVVGISNEFEDLFLQWKDFQCINAYSGSSCWRLLIRRREDNNGSNIVDGWQKLRDDLGLNIGNVCVFQCPTKSYDQFRIRVWRNDDE